MTYRFNPIDQLHPLTPAVYLAGALVLVMASFHPVCVTLAVVGGLLLSWRVRGFAATAKGLLWQVPFALLVAVVNPLFVHQGATVLFMMGKAKVTLEAVLYGVTMGQLLLATMVWFMCAVEVMTSDKAFSLMGNKAPVLGTMLGMVQRLVPTFVRRAKQIGDVEAANTAAHGVPEKSDVVTRRDVDRARGKVAQAVNRVSVLMAWGMEDSLDTADSMTARGWGGDARRTAYRRTRFTGFDGVCLGVVLVLGALAAWGAVQVCAGFEFYPVLGPWRGGADVLPCVAMALYLALPTGFDAIARWLWNRR